MAPRKKASAEKTLSRSRATKVSTRKCAAKKGSGKTSARTAKGSMKRFISAESQTRYSRQMRAQGCTIGFVPTMGAFHEGHLSLIRRARSQNDVVVVSIFVNPLQFGPGEDFERYPRDLARDADLARQEGVDALFVPEVEEMYPPGFSTKITVGEMATKMCGASRPGHFDGVCTVVMKLIGIVQPHRIYLGRKDAQQLIILQKMIRELNVDVKVVDCPTVREKDGLAMSSRNAYLTPEERQQAPVLYKALRMAQREILVGGERDPQRLKSKMERMILDGTSFKIDYIAMVDPETLEERKSLAGRTLIALAAYLGKARLIDNIMVDVPGGRMAESVG